jgi:hypothetical protein
MIKRPKLTIHSGKEGNEILTKGKGNLLTAENFPTLYTHPCTGGISNSK